jgi:hypothetical protein
MHSAKSLTACGSDGKLAKSEAILVASFRNASTAAAENVVLTNANS